MEANYTWITIGLPSRKRKTRHCCQVPIDSSNPTIIDIMGVSFNLQQSFKRLLKPIYPGIHISV